MPFCWLSITVTLLTTVKFITAVLYNFYTKLMVAEPYSPSRLYSKIKNIQVVTLKVSFIFDSSTRTFANIGLLLQVYQEMNINKFCNNK